MERAADSVGVATIPLTKDVRSRTLKVEGEGVVGEGSEGEGRGREGGVYIGGLAAKLGCLGIAASCILGEGLP